MGLAVGNEAWFLPWVGKEWDAGNRGMGRVVGEGSKSALISKLKCLYSILCKNNSICTLCNGPLG